MKTKCLLLALVLFNILSLSYAHAQDDEMVFPESDSETFVPPTGSTGTPPVIIDESDSSDVSDVEEYDG